MPIYAYKCSTCGFSRDVLQKMSDPLLTTCSECGAETLVKQLTAAGFQLKGSGWYATDFRGGTTPAPCDEDRSGKVDAAPAESQAKTTETPESGKAEKAAAPAPAASAPAAAAPSSSPAAAPASSPSPAKKVD